MKWNSLKPNPTWTILYLNINNIKMPPLKKKKNMMKMKVKLNTELWEIFIKYTQF
jgi:hypothetical protein